MIIWDLKKPPDLFADNIYLWNSYDDSKYSSIPLLLEKNSKNYRSKYLEFIFNLSNKKIDNQNIIEYLLIEKDFSLWWMNKLIEKSPFHSKSIFASLKLLLLADLVNEKKINKITLYSNDKKLHFTLKEFCNDKNIKYYYINKYRREFNLKFSSIFYSLNYSIKAIIYILYYYFKIFKFKKNTGEKINYSKADISIISFLAHLNESAFKTGIFETYLWGKLPSFLINQKNKINFFHIYMNLPKIKKKQEINLSINKINNSINYQGYHQLTDSFVSINLILKVIKFWIILHFKTYNIKKYNTVFRVNKSNLNLSYYLKEDFLDSIYGKEGIMNILWLELSKKIFKNINHQKYGIYIYENKPWEIAMIYSWKKYNHGKLIGVADSTIPFWHLYYFQDKKIYNIDNEYSLPVPDSVAINGEVSFNALTNSGFNENRIISVEALRYNYLKKNLSEKKSYNEVLILGDLSSESMINFLKLIEETIKKIKKINFSIKFHPVKKINLNSFMKSKIKIVDQPLNEILHKFDCVISANSTSASVDAYISGLEVIILYDNENLNLNPLKDYNDVHFVNNSSKLAEILINNIRKNKNSILRDKYFNINKDLPKWKNIFK